MHSARALNSPRTYPPWLITLVQILSDNDEAKIDIPYLEGALTSVEASEPVGSSPCEAQRFLHASAGNASGEVVPDSEEVGQERAIDPDVLDDVEPLTAAGGQPMKDGACR